MRRGMDKQAADFWLRSTTPQPFRQTTPSAGASLDNLSRHLKAREVVCFPSLGYQIPPVRAVTPSGQYEGQSKFDAKLILCENVQLPVEPPS